MHGYSNTDTCNTYDMWMTPVAGFKDELINIMEDLTDRIMEADHNVISGVSKFIKAYQMMIKSHAPNSSIHMLYTTLESQTVSQSFYSFYSLIK